MVDVGTTESEYGGLVESISTMFHWTLGIILAKVVCPNFIQRPFQDLTKPEIYGLQNAINLRIPVNHHGAELGDLGAWFIRPIEDGMMEAEQRWRQIQNQGAQHRTEQGNGDHTSQSHCEIDSQDCVMKKSSVFEGHYLADRGEIVVLYLHGNAETRSASHRLGLFYVFQAMGIPVLAVDYRGYGDSTGITFPSETSTVQDGLAAFHWLKSRVHHETKIVIWGHSLGAAVTAKLGADLTQTRDKPNAYVLENPFNNLMDEIRTFKLAKMIEYTGIDLESVVLDADLEFKSDERVPKINEPVLMLTAEDDNIIPFQLTEQLYQIASKEKLNVDLKVFKSALGLGHDYLYQSEELQVQFLSFVTKYLKD